MIPVAGQGDFDEASKFAEAQMAVVLKQAETGTPSARCCDLVCEATLL